MNHFIKAARSKVMSVAHFSDRVGSTDFGQEYGYYGGQDEEQGLPTSFDPSGRERTILSHKKNEDGKQPLTRPSARPQQPASHTPSFHSQNSVNTQQSRWSHQGSSQLGQHVNSMQGLPPNANPSYLPPSTPVNQKPQAQLGYGNQPYYSAQGQAAQYYGPNQASSPPIPDPYATPVNNQPGYPLQYPPPQGGYQTYAVQESMGLCIHRYSVYTYRTECPYKCVYPAYN